jgi:formylglycine-generating enzyme required for sulfatase activity
VSTRCSTFAIFTLLASTVCGCGDVPMTAPETVEMVFSTPAGLDHTMVLVSEGVFLMGAEDGLDDEGPVHQIHLDAFYIDKFEVTNQKYVLFVEATGSHDPVHLVTDAFNQPSQPVVGVGWAEASDYCVWAGLRLPTEAEWEKAARGEDGQTFPWGSGPPSPSLLRYLNTEGPVAVGSFPSGQSPFGAEDMAGNVWEYVRDHYVEGYYRISPDRNPVAIVGDGEPDHTIRGGSWASTPDEVRSTRRGRLFLLGGDLPDSQVGFRCARS